MPTPAYFLLSFLLIAFLSGWYGLKKEIGGLLGLSFVAFTCAIVMAFTAPLSYTFTETSFQLIDSGSYVTVITPEQSYETKNMTEAFNWKDQTKKGYIQEGYNIFGGSLFTEKKFIKK